MSQEMRLEERPHPENPDIDDSNGAPAGKKLGWFYLVYGTIFPFIVIGVELVTGICAEALFNPIPTIWHTLLVICVPVSNLLIWLNSRGMTRISPSKLRLANGVGIGVALYYTVIFLPVTPAAIIGIVFIIGLLTLAPLISLIAAVRGLFYLRKTSTGPRWRVARVTVWGFVAGLALLTLASAPVLVTRVCMQTLAHSSSERDKSVALKALRIMGDEEFLLQRCYRPVARPMGFLTLVFGHGRSVSIRQAREIFYRTTGKAFNSISPPESIIGNRGMSRWFEFDPDAGAASVAGRVKGLSLASSQIDGSMDADAALAYLQWTMRFRNDSRRPQEARAQILLPPGAVVSRLTLWVNGEEREAAFAGRGRVRQAYQKVVKRQRDPVLVTTCGPDRILVQCFPVPPKGGEMQIRIGVTAPLDLADRDSGSLSLPRIVERNFRIKSANRRLVWVESNGRLSSKVEGLKLEHPKDKLFALRGELAESALNSGPAVIEVERNPRVSTVWAEDPGDPAGKIVVQELKEASVFHPKSVVLVIDGSKAMQGHIDDICEALKSLPKSVELAVLVASDTVINVGDKPTALDPASINRITEKLKSLDFEGGCDTVPALAKAWEIAVKSPDSAILLIQGPQPVVMATPASITHRMERRPGSVRVLDFEAKFGPNPIAKDLEQIPSYRRIPRRGDFRADLEALFASWRSGFKQLAPVRTTMERSGLDTLVDARKTSAHLARLWAFQRVANLSESHSKDSAAEAVEIASKYHLVTPFTGAVVLETQKQFSQAGLTPVDAKDVPTIPEPETWLLIAVALFLTLWFGWRRRIWQTA